MLSSSAPDHYIRPVITFVIAASGLKYVGVGTTALGWILCGTLLAAAATWLAYIRPRQAAAGLAAATTAADELNEAAQAISGPATAERPGAVGAASAAGDPLPGPHSA
jgi:hypothetical protein